MQPHCIKKKKELDKQKKTLPENEQKDNTKKASPSIINKKKETPVYSEYKNSSPSLKNISNKENKEQQPKITEEKDSSSLLKQVFSDDELKTAWLRYAETIKLDMPRIYQVLKNNIPTKISDNTIIVNLNNESQKKELSEKIKPKVMKFIINELKNSEIQLRLEVAEHIETSNQIYTITDRYNFLADKNKTLHLFKKSFNLDFE